MGKTPEQIDAAIFEVLPQKPLYVLECLCGGRFTDAEVKERFSVLLNDGVLELTSNRILQLKPGAKPKELNGQKPETPTKTVLELLRWARDIVHCSHSGMSKDDCQWPFCREAIKAIKQMETPKA